jgi:hypothetical protein
LISAYLLYSKETELVPVLRNKCRTILLPYILWHIIIIGFYFIATILPFTKQFFTPEKPISAWKLVDWIKAFLGDYYDKDDFNNIPFVYQFWFLRDLFILNIFFVIIRKIVNGFPLGAFVIITVLWINNVKIYIVSPEALFFFTLGYYSIKYNLNEKNVDKIKMVDLLTIYVITIISEFLFGRTTPILHKINIIIGCIFFLRLSWYFIKNIKIFKILVFLEKYQFMVYAVHGIIIPQLLKIYASIVPINGIFILVGYFFMMIFGILFSLIFGILFKKIFPRANRILTGGRA